MVTLHYFYDPLCGWCYGAAPLVLAARQVLPVVAHGGGMMVGPHRRSVTPEFRAYVQAHDARIARLSGQPFGPAYCDGLLWDAGVVLDSKPPTAAILAAETLAGRGLDMLARLQIAHYVEGRSIAERATLMGLAEELGLAPPAFARGLDCQLDEGADRHFQESRRLMAEWGIQGFPGFVLAQGGNLHPMDVASYLGKPQEFQDWLSRQV